MPSLALRSAATITATGAGTAVMVPAGIRRTSIVLTASSFGGTVNPSLTIQTQVSADDGTNWITIAQQAIVQNGVQVVAMDEWLPPRLLMPKIRSNTSATNGTAETAVVTHELYYEA